MKLSCTIYDQSHEDCHRAYYPATEEMTAVLEFTRFREGKIDFAKVMKQRQPFKRTVVGKTVTYEYTGYDHEGETVQRYVTIKKSDKHPGMIYIEYEL